MAHPQELADQQICAGPHSVAQKEWLPDKLEALGRETDVGLDTCLLYDLLADL